ncbi:hypothetical protein VYA_44840 (plasmid) [Vibrio alfacsensis]|nr:hypothetical protein VYA_44840 [Vibrio alfacsensis]
MGVIALCTIDSTYRKAHKTMVDKDLHLERYTISQYAIGRVWWLLVSNGFYWLSNQVFGIQLE